MRGLAGLERPEGDTGEGTGGAADGAAARRTCTGKGKGRGSSPRSPGGAGRGEEWRAARRPLGKALTEKKREKTNRVFTLHGEGFGVGSGRMMVDGGWSWIRR